MKSTDSKHEWRVSSGFLTAPNPLASFLAPRISSFTSPLWGHESLAIQYSNALAFSSGSHRSTDSQLSPQLSPLRSMAALHPSLFGATSACKRCVVIVLDRQLLCT